MPIARDVQPRRCPLSCIVCLKFPGHFARIEQEASTGPTQRKYGKSGAFTLLLTCIWGLGQSKCAHQCGQVPQML